MFKLSKNLGTQNRRVEVSEPKTWATMIAVYVALLILAFNSINGASFADEKNRQLRNALTTDFEGGMQPWFDYSPGNVNWFLETFDSPLEPLPTPPPVNGSKYARVVRRDPTASGTAVLRSPLFVTEPGEQIVFSFWIRSRFLGANNIEVLWMNGAREERLLSLSDYSSISNFEWRTASVAIPALQPTETRIIINGVCGAEAEDAVAIDNIFVGITGDVTTTTQGSNTGTTTTAQTTTQPPNPGQCPTNLGGDSRIPCFVGTNGKCYCFGQYSQQWTNAESTCRNGGMKLVSVETADEQNAITSLLQSHSNLVSADYYTSAQLSSNKWTWSGSGQDVTYTNWITGEPNGSGNCMYLNNDFNYQWGDVGCTSLILFICEQ